MSDCTLAEDMIQVSVPEELDIVMERVGGCLTLSGNASVETYRDIIMSARYTKPSYCPTLSFQTNALCLTDTSIQHLNPTQVIVSSLLKCLMELPQVQTVSHLNWRLWTTIRPWYVEY